MAEQKRDYYEVLGVDRNADENTIKRAYRSLAKKYHPDMHPGDAEAEAKFKEASEAYAVLSDPEKKSKYDQFGHSAFEGGAGGGGFDFSGMDFTDIFSDIFGDFFGGGMGRRSSRSGPMRGANLRARITIDFKEAVFGCEKKIEITLKDPCNTCNGSGCKPGTSKIKCAKCGGKGKVVMMQQSLFGQMQTVTTCPDCDGEGEVAQEKCSDCKGTGYVSARKTLSVSIPAGIDDGQAVRLPGKGEPGTHGGPRGDILVEVRVRPHEIFQRNGYDLYSAAPISYAQAALGGEVIIDTIDGKVNYQVSAGTQTDTRIRLRGKGVPSTRNPNTRGDHFVTLIVQVPTGLSNEAQEALKKFDSLSGDTLRPGGVEVKSEKKKRSFRDLFN